MSNKASAKPKANTQAKAKANKTAKASNNNYGAFGNYKGVKVSKVKKLANAEIKPQITALQGKSSSNLLATQQEQDKRQNLYDRQVAGINHAFGASDADIAKRNQNITDIYNAAAKQDSAASAALQQTIQQKAQGLGQQTGDGLSSLGIGGSMNLGQFNADTNNAVNVAGINGQNSAANLQAMQFGASSVGDLLRSQNSGAKTAALGNSLNSLNSDLSDINNDYRLQNRDIQNDINTAKAQKPSIVNQMLQQMAQQGWQQHMDQANVKLQKQYYNSLSTRYGGKSVFGGHSKSSRSSGSSKTFKSKSTSTGKSKGGYAGLLKDLVD